MQGGHRPAQTHLVVFLLVIIEVLLLLLGGSSAGTKLILFDKLLAKRRRGLKESASVMLLALGDAAFPDCLLACFLQVGTSGVLATAASE